MESDVKKPIPLKGAFMTNKIDDRIYGYMRAIEYKGVNIDGEEIYFCYDNGLLKDIAKELNINLRTVQRKVKNMVELGLLTKDKVHTVDKKDVVNCYRFKSVDYYKDVDKDTLLTLVKTLQEDVIKVYAYLLNGQEYKNNIGENYLFSIGELISNCLGIKKATHERDYDTIKRCIDMLERLGLLRLGNKKTRKKIKSGNSKYTYYFEVKEVKTKLPSKSELQKQFLEDLGNGKNEFFGDTGF